MTQLSHDQQLDILTRAHEARRQGHEEEGIKLSQLLPLAPHLAKALKELEGAEYLKKSGFDLSEAEAIYGQNWLNQ